MTIKDLIEMLEKVADGTPERYSIHVRDGYGDIYDIEEIDSDEGAYFIRVDYMGKRNERP